MTTLTFHLSRSLSKGPRIKEILSKGQKPNIILTRLDHDGNVSPWEFLAEETGAEIR